MPSQQIDPPKVSRAGPAKDSSNTVVNRARVSVIAGEVGQDGGPGPATPTTIRVVSATDDPTVSSGVLITLSQTELMMQILVELRAQTALMIEGFALQDDAESYRGVD